VVEDRPITSAEYPLPLLAKTSPLCSAVCLRSLSYLLKILIMMQRSTMLVL